MSIADRANLVRRMEEEDKELLQDVDTSDNESDETENMQKQSVQKTFPEYARSTLRNILSEFSCHSLAK